MAVQQRAVTAAAVYFRLFMPTSDWAFDGSGMRGPSATFDLIGPQREALGDDGEVQVGLGLTDTLRLRTS